jgi:D-alanyl-D-alanine carboxypeptidase/D-alanyl-D-alanine-endopeptidase (penicillin-binding protein 4)
LPKAAPRERTRPSARWVVAALALLTASVVAGTVAVADPYLVGKAIGASGPSWRAGVPPSPPTAVLEAPRGDAAEPTPAGVAAAIDPLIADAGLGGHTAISVMDVATGHRLYGRGGNTPLLPASTAKLVTALAVLATRGPAQRLTTMAVAGANPGEVVLVGAGDPTLSAAKTGGYPGAARLADLADQVRRALGGTAATRVLVDSSLFSGPGYGPGWDPESPTEGFVAAITALMTDGGRIDPTRIRSPARRFGQPDMAAGQALATLLGLPGTAVGRGQAPPGARQLGAVQSPPLVRLVEIMLSESDNVIAECLARQVALARGQPATFAGAASAIRAVLRELGLPAGEADLVDGSGLSRTDRLAPSLLTDVLALAARPEWPQLRGVFTGLPVAAYSGTLRDRYRAAGSGAAAAGLVRAKTGTLTGVSSIAGIAIDADGRVLAFAIMADAVTAGTTAAEGALDRIAAALAACGCRGT